MWAVSADSGAVGLAVAQMWLERLGRAATADAVAALVPYVAGADVVGSEGNAWRSLVMKGELPTPDAVAATVRQRLDPKAVAAGTALAESPAGERAARFVRDYRETHGVGPEWAELAAGMGWAERRAVWTFAIRRLKAKGWLSYTPKNRSMDLGEKGRSHLAYGDGNLGTDKPRGAAERTGRLEL